MAVRTELLESAIPEELIKQLPYPDVTAEEAKRLTGFKLEGWVVGMNSPSGEPYKTSDLSGGKAGYSTCIQRLQRWKYPAWLQDSRGSASPQHW